MCAMKSVINLLLLTLFIGVSGCASPEQYADSRSKRLLEEYPPGTTTRADVQKRWSPVAPDLSETRPASDWSACAQPVVRERVVSSEQRTGHAIYRCER